MLGRAQQRTPARVSLTRAVLGGGLYVHGDQVEEAVSVSRVLSRPSPAYKRWLVRSRQGGKQAGPPPAERVWCAGPIPDGPWQGAWWLPRHAPIAVQNLTDRTQLPPAERLQLSVKLRPYQIAARDALLWERSGTVVMPCGAGKTTTGAAVIAELATPALVLVHTLDLATQWMERVRDQLGATVGLVGGGKREDGCRVTVATIQTLTNWTWWERYEWGKRFGLVVLDEAHHAPARTFSEVMSSLPGRYRLGLTATPSRPDGLEDFLWWTCGPVIYRVEQRDLEETGSTMRPAIRWVHTGWAPERAKADDWTGTQTELVSDEARNRLIVDQVVSRARAGRVVLVLSDRVQHAVELAEQITARGVDAEPLVGRVTKKARQSILDRARAGELQVITATSVADEGLDAPVLDCVALTCPSRNKGKVQQRIGRVIRSAPGKPTPEVLDFVDDFKSAVHMAWQRFRLYRELGWGPDRPVQP